MTDYKDYKYIPLEKTPLHLVLPESTTNLPDQAKEERDRFWSNYEHNDYDEDKYYVKQVFKINGRPVFILDTVKFSYLKTYQQLSQNNQFIPGFGPFPLANSIGKLKVGNHFIVGIDRERGQLTSFSGHLDPEDFKKENLTLPNDMELIAPVLSNGRVDRITIKKMVASLEEYEQQSGEIPILPAIHNVMRETYEESGIHVFPPSKPLGIVQMIDPKNNGVSEFWTAYNLNAPFQTLEEVSQAFSNYDKKMKESGGEREIGDFFCFSGNSKEELMRILIPEQVNINGVLYGKRTNFDPGIIAQIESEKLRKQKQHNTPQTSPLILGRNAPERSR